MAAVGMMLAAATAPNPTVEEVRAAAIDSRRNYLFCLEEHLRSYSGPHRPNSSLNWSSRLSDEQTDLANRAKTACHVLRITAVGSELNLKALQLTGETAFDLRVRLETEMSDLEEGRIRSWFQVGWVM